MSEADFSRSLVKFWRSQGYFVQRIETGSIGRGVPDIFVATRKGDLWVELKNMKSAPYEGMRIPWRPGQQAWMYSYYLATGRYCYTIAKCYRTYIAIPMVKLFPHNEIRLSDVTVFNSIKDILL